MLEFKFLRGTPKRGIIRCNFEDLDEELPYIEKDSNGNILESHIRHTSINEINQMRRDGQIITIYGVDLGFPDNRVVYSTNNKVIDWMDHPHIVTEISNNPEENYWFEIIKR